MLRGLGHYRLLKALSQGSQADVYLALDTRLERRVCIKVYHLQGDLSSRRRLQEEARKLARIDSPQVLEVLDIVGSRDELALVTAYVPGCTFQQLIDEVKVLEPQEAVLIASDIAIGLAALCQARLIHGDLSPRNIFLHNSGGVVVGDFGVAVLRGQRPAGFSIDALSPEHLPGSDVEMRSDFFALGLLLFQGLTGRHPFLSNGVLDTDSLRRGLTVAPDLPQVVPEAGDAIGELLLSLLAADPERRPRNPLELRQRLLEIRSLLPNPAGLPEKVRRTARRLPDLDLPLRLPPRLLRPSAARKLGGLVMGFWQRSTLQLRFAVLLVGLLPAVLLGMWWSAPVRCIAVIEPEYRLDARRSVPLLDVGLLHTRLTSVLKEALPRSLILGQGPKSDSEMLIGPAGVRDRCVAQHDVGLSVACDASICRFEMLTQTPDTLHASQLDMPVNAGERRLEQTLRQLVDASRFLLEP